MFKPWAEVWEDVDTQTEEPLWYARYETIEGHPHLMRLDAMCRPDALHEVSSLTEIPENEIQG